MQRLEAHNNGSSGPIGVGEHEGISQAPIVENLFTLAEAGIEKGVHTIDVFTTKRQAGMLYLPTSPEIRLSGRQAQQTMQVLAGEARMKSNDRFYDLADGNVAVLPSNVAADIVESTDDFLLYSITSKDTTQDSDNNAKDNGTTLLIKNLYELYQSAERESFMSTDESNQGANTESAVDEIEVFFPGEEGYMLNKSQAGRLLIYGEKGWGSNESGEIWLDWHTHSLAQHAIYVLRGNGRVGFGSEQEEQTFELNRGDIAIVPTGARHRLGSVGPFLASVINTPGIPPTHPNYSHPA